MPKVSPLPQAVGEDRCGVPSAIGAVLCEPILIPLFLSCSSDYILPDAPTRPELRHLECRGAAPLALRGDDDRVPQLTLWADIWHSGLRPSKYLPAGFVDHGVGLTDTAPSAPYRSRVRSRRAALRKLR